MCRLFFTTMLLVLAVMTANPAIASSNPPPPPQVTWQECESEWDTSPASQTCTLRGTTVTDNKCNFGATCTYQTTTGDNRGDASITGVPKENAGNLYHCEPLVLQVGSC